VLTTLPVCNLLGDVRLELVSRTDLGGRAVSRRKRSSRVHSEFVILLLFRAACLEILGSSAAQVDGTLLREAQGQPNWWRAAAQCGARLPSNVSSYPRTDRRW
jgi:hypothetical protein